MGKKKAQKIKELAVAIGEASAIGDESGQNQSQPQTLRKRGRPRKIVEKKDDDAAEESLEKPLEKNKNSEQEEGCESPQVDSSACTWITKEEVVSSQEGEPSRSRKARRKSKPRKSST